MAQKQCKLDITAVVPDYIVISGGTSYPIYWGCDLSSPIGSGTIVVDGNNMYLLSKIEEDILWGCGVVISGYSCIEKEQTICLKNIIVDTE